MYYLTTKACPNLTTLIGATSIQITQLKVILRACPKLEVVDIRGSNIEPIPALIVSHLKLFLGPYIVSPIEHPHLISSTPYYLPSSLNFP